MKIPRFLFMHGWGFDRNFWKPVRQAMGQHNGDSLDFGYFGQSKLEYDWSQPFIAVGHSLGFLWLLQQPLAACIQLISINGFSRFFADPDWPFGVPQRVTKRMQLALHRDAKKTVDQFYETLAFFDISEKRYDLAALDNGLEFLMKQDNRSIAKKQAHKIAIMASDQDPIVPVSLTKACFPTPTPILWNKDGGHLLPITDPDSCANFIRDVVKCIK
ncbi:pimeloyl-[acyl-carrier protein] methyl ester esterase [Zymomonas mobilis]|uniref:alpha/beta fold hydrolase n=1 Tax=Zymomonas mobilis TaxID=542 RepID=UPI00026D843F|nr:alpha/beta hydrolase [Zymomonas mobilis]AFN57114.1 hypothetical protein ZZ6_1234 [Zymomonas mobilis subsp. mobilis ATCC 29191]TQK77443.1 pimeloyl-[acyl-carrier protein] methyl ester esterase [Zymomonas mobilis]TQL15900.1 pimeloyl-[acyl-carrier protein] methyl ester esterase [Zymomonas mobilis]GEB87938.1 alpha/beta hydrolase [Zymomonas mobilis subsp. mobilis]